MSDRICTRFVLNVWLTSAFEIVWIANEFESLPISTMQQKNKTPTTFNCVRFVCPDLTFRLSPVFFFSFWFFFWCCCCCCISVFNSHFTMIRGGPIINNPQTRLFKNWFQKLMCNFIAPKWNVNIGTPTHKLTTKIPKGKRIIGEWTEQKKNNNFFVHWRRTHTQTHTHTKNTDTNETFNQKIK